MTKLHVEAEQTVAATPEAIWALVSDATTYSQWGPWRKAEYRSEGETSPHGVGAVYRLESEQRYAFRHPVSIEKIVASEEGRHLAYTVIGGIPVRNYRADITITPADGGTHLRWEATWDQTLAGRLVHRSLRVLYPQIVADVAKAAEAAEKSRLT